MLRFLENAKLAAVAAAQVPDTALAAAMTARSLVVKVEHTFLSPMEALLIAEWHCVEVKLITLANGGARISSVTEEVSFHNGHYESCVHLFPCRADYTEIGTDTSWGMNHWVPAEPLSSPSAFDEDQWRREMEGVSERELKEAAERMAGTEGVSDAELAVLIENEYQQVRARRTRFEHMHAKMLKHGFLLKEVPTDGDCLLHSFAVLLKCRSGPDDNVQARATIAALYVLVSMFPQWQNAWLLTEGEGGILPWLPQRKKIHQSNRLHFRQQEIRQMSQQQWLMILLLKGEQRDSSERAIATIMCAWH